MDDLEYWRLCGELSVMQAALLAVGVDPASEAGAYCEDWKPHERPRGYEALKTAIVSALRKGEIKGVLVPLYEYDINGNICDEVPGSIDIRDSNVEVTSVREWLASHGLARPSGFFSDPSTPIQSEVPASLLKRLNEAEAEAADLRQQLRQERAAIDDAARMITRLQTDVRELVEQNLNYQANYKQLQRLFSYENQQREQAETRCRDSLPELEAAQSEIAALRNQLEQERASRGGAEQRAEQAEAEAAKLYRAVEDACNAQQASENDAATEAYHRHLSDISGRQPEAPSTGLTFPYATRHLEAALAAALEHWRDFDPTRPPLQKQVVASIVSRGVPTRQAEELARAIKRNDPQEA